MSKEPKSPQKYLMVESSLGANDDSIDLLRIIYILLQAWKTLLGATILCTVIAVYYALNTPEVFKAETLLAPARQEKSVTSSKLSQFGGLAAMAGITIPSDTNVERVIATLKTREFLKNFVQEKDLLPVIFSTFWDSSTKSWNLKEDQTKFVNEDGIAVLQSAIEVKNENSGLISLSIYWSDPVVAANWTNYLVRQLNKKLREKAIADSKKRITYLEQELAKTTLQDMRAVLYNLLESEKQKAMLANVNEDFALEVIDPAVVPKVRYKPNRKKMVLLGSVCGGFLGIFVVFFVKFLQKLKKSYS